MELTQNFNVEMSKLLNEKIRWLVNHYDKEIGAWLVGEITNEKIIIEDFLIPFQDVSSVSVDTSGSALVKLRKEYKTRCEKIIGHFHCITEEIPILLSNGSTITAKELYESDKKFKLVAYDYKDGFKFVKPKSIKKEYSPKILKIDVGNKKIKVTPNHLLMDKKGEWKQSKDFKIGDKIIMLKNFKVEKPKKVNKDVAYLYGSLLSEGCFSVKRINKKSVALRGNIANNNIEFLKRNQRIIKKLFNYEAVITERKLKKDKKDYTTPQLILGKNPICQKIVKDGFIIGRGIKRIPKMIMEADNKAKEIFLEAFIEGDGSIEKRSKNNIYKRIYTAYKEMASDFCYLLSSMGYKPLMRKMKQNFKKRNYDFLYEVYFQSVKQKEEKRKFDRKYKNVFLCKIKNIEECKGEDVYSIEIPKYYNYVCGFGGFISHNSHNTMGADWSSTDEEFIKEFITPREKAVFIVSSQKDKHKIRLEFNKPIRLSLDDLDYTIADEDSEVGEELKKEIEKKVIETKPTFAEKDKDFWEKENKLTKKQINNMVVFDNKTNNVFLRKLSLFQYYQIEGVFPIKNDVTNEGNGEVTIRYFTKEKGTAVQLMKDLREYMKEEFKEDDGEIDIDNEDIGGNYGIDNYGIDNFGMNTYDRQYKSRWDY